MLTTTFASLLFLTAPAAPVTPVSAVAPAAIAVQGKTDKQALRKELHEREAVLDKTDADGWFSLALWADRNGLELDAKRLFGKVIRADPNHANARKRLGYVKYDGKWVKKSQVAALEEKKRAAEYKAKGYVQHDGEWIKKSELAYFKRGYVRREGQWIRVADHKQYKADKVPHPASGVWIAKADLDKAKQNLFPVEGKWLSTKEANEVHGSWLSPWVLRGKDVQIVTTYPFEKAEQIMLEADTAVAKIRGVIFDPVLPLPKRIMLFVFGNQEDYRQFGVDSSTTGFSSYGAFFADNHPNRPTAVYYGQKDWGAYYLRHGVGLAISHQLLNSDKINGTSWIHTAVGSYLERFATPKTATWFSKKFMGRGGLQDLDKFWDRFQISPDLSTDAVERNIYQAGFLLLYAIKAGDHKVQKAWNEIREAIESKPRRQPRALKSFEKALTRSEQKIRNYLEKTASQG